MDETTGLEELGKRFEKVQAEIQELEEPVERYRRLGDDLLHLRKLILVKMGRMSPKIRLPRPKTAWTGIPTKAISEVLDVMKAEGHPMSPKLIASKLGVKTAAVYLRLKRAVDLGFVRKVGWGKYEC